MRKGNQIAPAEFTKHIDQAHDHNSYPAMVKYHFHVPADFTEKVKQALRKRKNNKAMGADGLHVEMFKA